MVLFLVGIENSPNVHHSGHHVTVPTTEEHETMDHENDSSQRTVCGCICSIGQQIYCPKEGFRSFCLNRHIRVRPVDRFTVNLRRKTDRNYRCTQNNMYTDTIRKRTRAQKRCVTDDNSFYAELKFSTRKTKIENTVNGKYLCTFLVNVEHRPGYPPKIYVGARWRSERTIL